MQTPEDPFVKPAASEPHGMLWLVYLFFRPRTFVRHFVVDAGTGLTMLAGYLYGMSLTVERIESRLSTGSSGVEPFVLSWGAYWTLVLIGGAIGGYMNYAIGGWWYRTRIGWCGAEDVDPKLSRRVYMFASLTWAIPYLGVTLMEATKFDTPRSAYDQAGGWVYLLLLIFPFWSLYTSYAGVRTVFSVRRLRGIMWFLMLPALCYSIGGILFAAAMYITPADIEHPNSFSSSTMRFSYPGNWWIDTTGSSHDPDYSVDIEAPQDAYVGIMIYETDDIEMALDSSITELSLSMNITERSPLDMLGGFEGEGLELRGTIEGRRARVRCFVAPVGDGMALELLMIAAVDDWDLVEPGLRQITTSLHILLPER